MFLLIIVLKFPLVLGCEALQEKLRLGPVTLNIREKDVGNGYLGSKGEARMNSKRDMAEEWWGSHKCE